MGIDPLTEKSGYAGGTQPFHVRKIITILEEDLISEEEKELIKTMINTTKNPLTSIIVSQEIYKYSLTHSSVSTVNNHKIDKFIKFLKSFSEDTELSNEENEQFKMAIDQLEKNYFLQDLQQQKK